MAFYPVQIAAVPGFGYESVDEFSTNIQPIANGFESRNADWDFERMSFTVPFKNVPIEAIRAIRKIFKIVRGQNHTFLHKDRGDYQAVDEKFGIGDGVTTHFQLSITNTCDGGGEYTRVITKPATGVVTKADGVIAGSAVSTTDGSVIFADAPDDGAILTWSGNFFIHVRFNSDKFTYTIDDKSGLIFITNNSADLIEVLGE
jgi:uncharacterized protein (TIGR02217 family)